MELGGVPADVSLEVTIDATGATVIALIGELDASNASGIRTELRTVVEREPEQVVFDLARLEFLDSSGIAVLLAVAARSGSVRVRGASDIIRRIIEATGLTEVLPREE